MAMPNAANQPSVLFLGKTADAHCAKALVLCESLCRVEAHLGSWGDPLPQSITDWQGDYIISYLSRWIIPCNVIQSARIAAINIHPAPPEYPGIGCTNFALYNEENQYGVTCHHMDSTVDTGEIIAIKRFPLLADDSVSSLLKRTYMQQFALFEKILDIIVRAEALPASDEKWTRPPYTRKEFDALCQITPDMDQNEIRKRVRATSFGKWQPAITLGNYTFELKAEE